MRYLCGGGECGRGGKSGTLNTAEHTMPSIADPIIQESICGVLINRALSLTQPGATHSGRRPIMVISNATSAHDQFPSHSTNTHLAFFQNGIAFPFFRNSHNKYGMCSLPHAQRRCCLYKFFTLCHHVSSRTVSMETGIYIGVTSYSPLYAKKHW